MEEIGWAENCFWDMDNQPIERAFKLYPWEFMFQEDFGPKTIEASTAWIEPIWKAVLSNKMILKVLWELFPDHPNLLRCQSSPTGMASYVKKPILSREGANIAIVENNETTAATAGEYGEEGYIFQEYVALPNFSGNRPVIGSWVVGDQAAGMGIRETKGLIHDNLARFVPHYFA
jgi:glutathionylspermidine synthase